jgi:hypothetical protein
LARAFPVAASSLITMALLEILEADGAIFIQETTTTAVKARIGSGFRKKFLGIIRSNYFLCG